jgi:hypothetical protein
MSWAATGRRTKSGPGLPSNAAASTSCAISRVKRRSMPWPRSATTSMASSTRPMLTRPAPHTQPFERTWNKRCPGVVASLREGGEELLTFFRFPRAQWKTLRTTNTIERLHEEFRRRVKHKARCRPKTRR